jgi:hypothetical protein
MKVSQRTWTANKGWVGTDGTEGRAQLVLVFGGSKALKDKERIAEVAKAHSGATIVGCTTSGEIAGTRVLDDSLVVTAVQFEHTKLIEHHVKMEGAADSRKAGADLGRKFDQNGLVHVFVLSDGLKVNGSELVAGLVSSLPASVAVTGGLAGDGSDFKQTLVWAGDSPEEGNVVAVGLYGDKLKIGYGSLGGWDAFGPERRVTKAKANVLYELDGESALSLYKTYLGEHAAGLPASGLLFPLCIKTEKSAPEVVRTILAVSEEDQSITFAGDIPEGSFARLMKANFENLIDGAGKAAQASHQSLPGSSPDLAILISCVGRKLVLKQRIEEEVESVRDILGEKTVLAGFYSYGEISPFTPSAKCELHNQTMTITTITEV